MNRPVPSLDTLVAIGDALSVHERRSVRPPAPPLPTRRPPLRPSEVAGALRGIDRDITAILSRPADLTARELTLAALGGQLLALAHQVEGER
jgi:hypothetical protein